MKKLINQMLEAYKSGDENLDQFPDSVEKEVLLSHLTMVHDNEGFEFTHEQILDFKLKIDNAENEVEKTKILIRILNSCNGITDELRDVLLEHKDLLDRIRIINKSFICYLPR